FADNFTSPKMAAPAAVTAAPSPISPNLVASIPWSNFFRALSSISKPKAVMSSLTFGIPAALLFHLLVNVQRLVRVHQVTKRALRFDLVQRRLAAQPDAPDFPAEVIGDGDCAFIRAAPRGTRSPRTPKKSPYCAPSVLPTT